MAMSHADCDHPRTPKDRAKCRSMREAALRGVRNEETAPVHTARKPAKLTVVPRTTRGRRSAVDVNLKRPGTLLRGRPDHADVPRVFMGAIEQAYRNDWDVKVGEVFDHTTRRIVIVTPHGDINLAWSASNPNGIQRVMWRASTQSTAWDMSLNQAIRLGLGEDE